jgi:hypothetical protein
MSLTVSSSYGPFPNRDTFQYGSLKWFDLPDIAQAACVCKLWNQAFSDQNLWKALFEKEGIPLVISPNGIERNYKEDFKTLYSITISGRIISQFIGKVVEKIPPISEKSFNELEEPDPYETGKLKRQTFVFVVDPSFVMRTVGKEAPLALDDLGNLIESPERESGQSPENTTEKSELKIPLSLKNIKVLCSYPLKGKENMPVFDERSENEVFEQCNALPDKIAVYFMRRHVIDQGKRMLYDEQRKLVEDKGFEVTPLRIRAIFDSVDILKEGTCPDGRASQGYIYSHHSETVFYGCNVYHTFIGCFHPGDGLLVNDDLFDEAFNSVAPGRREKVPTTDS